MEGPVNSVAISPDGKSVLSGSLDYAVMLWDLDTPKPTTKSVIQNHRFIAHNGAVSAVKFYPSGHYSKVVSIDISKDAKYAATSSWDGNIILWDLDSNKSIHKIQIHNDPVNGVLISDDAKTLYSAGYDGKIRSWDASTGPVWALAFNEDGKSLYYGSLDDEVKYWEITDKEDENLWIGHKPRRFQVKTGMPLGELQFARKCSVCHTLTPDDANRAGPTLHKVFGRKAGSLAGYSYSDSLKDSPIIWDEKTIDDLFVEGPAKIVPGTKMPLQKVADDKKRKALIAYLKKATK
ncbi:Cytochrome c [Nymphon striatum]|nr:Cytochrome c [Nymphon striatum]